MTPQGIGQLVTGLNQDAPSLTGNITTSGLTGVIPSVITDAQKTEQDAVALYHAYKSKGMEGLVAMASTIAGDIDKDMDDIGILEPLVKQGYKTTEFWLIIGYFVVNVFAQKLNITLPPIDDVTIGGLVAAYTLSRTSTKNKTK